VDERRLVRISKYLAKHLRHRPERVGIELDAHGWVEIDALLAATAAHGFPISREELEEVVARNDKRRFMIDGDRIRANQGHTVPVDLDLPVVEPPPLLHHGTVARNLPAIRMEGLRRMGRPCAPLPGPRDRPRGRSAPGRAGGARRGGRCDARGRA